MASKTQLKDKLTYVMSRRVAVAGQEPPRLVRANSAFAKAGEK